MIKYLHLQIKWVTVFPVAIKLDIDRGIYLIIFIEKMSKKSKKYIRGVLIMVQNTILTSTFVILDISWKS